MSSAQGLLYPINMHGGLLNLLTSCCFIWTLVHAQVRECYQLEFGCLSCLLTSWLYHGSRMIVLFHTDTVRLFRWVDMATCQFCVVYFTYQCASWHWLYVGTIVALCYIFTMFYLFEASARKLDGDMWHSTLHIVANLGISCLIEACYNTAECALCHELL